MIPAPLRKQLTEQRGVHQLTPMPPGLSGARVFRCDGDETLVLRCWPQGTAPNRVHEIHSVIATVASTFQLLPKYKPIDSRGWTYTVDASGLIWELATWMPGRPLTDDASLQLIGRGTRAIADLHQALTHVPSGALPSQFRTAPALAERLQRIAWLDEQLPRTLSANLDGRVHPSVAAALERARGVLQHKWPATATRLSAALAPLARRRWPLQYVVRDIHREHVLFSGGAVSGIIDFDALRIDTVAVDLARWAASFTHASRTLEDVIDRVLADYRAATPFPNRPAGSQGDTPSAAPGSVAKPDRIGQADRILGRPLGPETDFGASDSAEFRTLVLLIAESSLWISLANWVVWLVGESRQFPDLQLVSERLRRLIESVDG
ncbi:Phosphotransferase enzyme family protein [Stieleria maiorica]|uniref:Phosphotransferase enzyme family protein n=1 Tax=Stieleria maiorica TaxID=2795974 RepID=A0A5B9MNZ9_9BACT|nr:aminoglycoside phosphotransferase family protein [Stieleria maiorica]QEG02694.1 Phosphotransferase enzyme family protein [Stieleria maiorica]